MPLVSQEGVAINNIGITNATVIQEAKAAIQKLQLGDLWRKGNTIVKETTVRIDCQGVTADGQSNIQIQLNGTKGNSTIGHVLINRSVGEFADKIKPDVLEAQQKYVMRTVQGALQNSLSSGKTFTITGTPI